MLTEDYLPEVIFDEKPLFRQWKNVCHVFMYSWDAKFSNLQQKTPGAPAYEFFKRVDVTV